MNAIATSEKVGAKVTWSENEFIDAAVQYGTVKTLLDALVKIKPSDRKRAVERAHEVIGLLTDMADNASSYTPSSDMGFGSENAANIADAILGRRATSGKLKTTFAKLAR